MRASDTDALICDFAQYYHIYDFQALELKQAAVLACGLPEESRIMRIMKGQKYGNEEMIMLAILDTLRAIEYAYVKAHCKDDADIPEYRSLLAELSDGREPEETDSQWFSTADDFRTCWEKATKKVEEDVG